MSPKPFAAESIGTKWPLAFVIELRKRFIPEDGRVSYIAFAYLKSVAYRESRWSDDLLIKCLTLTAKDSMVIRHEWPDLSPTVGCISTSSDLWRETFGPRDFAVCFQAARRAS